MKYNKQVGFKVSGGVKVVEDADEVYVGKSDNGSRMAYSSCFRIGTSSLEGKLKRCYLVTKPLTQRLLFSVRFAQNNPTPLTAIHRLADKGFLYQVFSSGQKGLP